LIKAAKEYSNGNFDYQWKLHCHDGYRDLGNTMGYIVNKWKSSADYQTKIIANISHDFRSPLTSMKGYAEAMIDGTIPPELHAKYLDIILFETERLTKLTSNLLELNNFENRGAHLDIASFDINSVIKRTAASFEGACRKKRIILQLEFSSDESYVDADVAKIQQVLYNLIDNATKFANNNTAIIIETNIRNEKVLISVKDTGIGIPRDSTKKIWERFYKTDQSRGRDKKGSGLGLAIVKDIIQAHNENINVISTEGVGTEFIFTLPLSEKEV
jgi:signal transduction histidine kinase